MSRCFRCFLLSIQTNEFACIDVLINKISMVCLKNKWESETTSVIKFKIQDFQEVAAHVIITVTKPVPYQSNWKSASPTL